MRALNESAAPLNVLVGPSRRPAKALTPQDPLGKRGKTPRKRARKRERERTRNKNTNAFGYVDVYEHEHVHVSASTLKLLAGFTSLP